MAWKYQTGATELSFSGYYQDVLHTWDKNGLRKPNTTVEDSLYFVNTKKLNAKDYILEQSKNTDIIIINEAHHMAQHRMFTKSLLKDLYANGYRYLGLEALFETTINYRKYPVIESGYYTKEPEFGNLIAEALKLGFTLFNYVATPGKNGKEHEIEFCAQLSKYFLNKKFKPYQDSNGNWYSRCENYYDNLHITFEYNRVAITFNMRPNELEQLYNLWMQSYKEFEFKWFKYYWNYHKQDLLLYRDKNQDWNFQEEKEDYYQRFYDCFYEIIKKYRQLTGK